MCLILFIYCFVLRGKRGGNGASLVWFLNLSDADFNEFNYNLRFSSLDGFIEVVFAAFCKQLIKKKHEQACDYAPHMLLDL